MFCPLTPSRRLRLFASPALPAAAASLHKGVGYEVRRETRMLRNQKAWGSGV